MFFNLTQERYGDLGSGLIHKMVYHSSFNQLFVSKGNVLWILNISTSSGNWNIISKKKTNGTSQLFTAYKEGKTYLYYS